MGTSDAEKKHSWSATVSMLKDLTALLGHLVIVVLGVLLVAFPVRFNAVLVNAGVDEWSVIGLKWKRRVAENTETLNLAEDTISKLRSENEVWRKAATDAQDKAIVAMSQVDLEKLKARAQRADDEAKQVQDVLASALGVNKELLAKSPPLAPRNSVPNQAFCYQEDRLQDGMSRFSVHCHATLANCEKARGPSKVRTQSACISTDLSIARWSPGHPGYIGSWFQFGRTPFGFPFPQLQN